MGGKRIYPDRILTPTEKAKRSQRAAQARGKCPGCFKPKDESNSRVYCTRCLEKVRARTKRRRKELWKEVLEAYGPRCACCSETNPLFLTVDHINNDGHLEKQATPNLLYHIRKLNFPKDRYRIMCFNCNCGRARNGGICPHEEGL